MRYKLVGRGFKKSSRNLEYLQRLAKRLSIPWEIHMILPSKMRMKSFERFKDSVMKIIMEEIDRGHSVKSLTPKYHCSEWWLHAQVKKYKTNLSENPLQLS